MKRTDQQQQLQQQRTNSNSSDLNSISPPAVQFAIGTPPIGGRHRSASGTSLSETPPPPCTWQVSPATNSSPLRRSGTTSPILSMQKLPALNSPTTMLDNNNHHLHHHHHHNSHVLSQRAFTLPEMGATGGLCNFFGAGCAVVNTNDDDDDPAAAVTFHAPELPAETLLDREHNETLAKLNFVLALTDCILEVADSKCAPLSALMSADAIPPMAPHAPENCKRTERLVLLMRNLQLLSSGLSLAKDKLKNGYLKPSNTVKTGK